MISGLKKVAVYDPSTGTTVQLNTVSPEGEFKKEPMSVEDGSGGFKYAGDDASFQFDAFDSSGFTQLETWMEAETEVNLVTEGIDEHILWYENSLLTVKKNLIVPVGSRNSFSVNIAKKGGQLDIFSGNNLLYAWKNWVDANADEVADGWAITPGADLTEAFSSDQQQITATAPVADGEILLANLIYPLSNVSFNCFNNVVANTINSGLIKVLEKTYAGATLATTSDATLTTVLSLITESTQYKFDIYLLDTGDLDSSDSLTLGVPYLGKKTSGLIKY